MSKIKDVSKEITDYIKMHKKMPLVYFDVDEDPEIIKLKPKGVTYFSDEDTDTWDKSLGWLNDNTPFNDTAIRSPQGKKGEYSGIKFDSIWEYAYYRYTAELHGEWVERNRTDFLEYTVDGHTHKFYPDFKTTSGFVEIKGILRVKDQEKMQQHPEVQFLFGPDIKPMIEELNRKIPHWRKDYKEL